MTAKPIPKSTNPSSVVATSAASYGVPNAAACLMCKSLHCDCWDEADYLCLPPVNSPLS